MKLITILLGMAIVIATLITGGNVGRIDTIIQTIRARPSPTSTSRPTQIPIPTHTLQPETYQAINERAARVGFPSGGVGPVLVTPVGTLYPFSWATPCNGWIDAAGVLFCVTATPVQPTSTQFPGYPAPSTPSGYP